MMTDFAVGNIVKTDMYYNTQPYPHKPIKKGTILEIQSLSNIQVALVRNERGHLIEIPTNHLIKVK
ncbi:hypothetical protein Ethha_2135 [Ethanoligenens harbinense YUAN-3]|uniref:Uncharacterized protein n=1 Tax=Ethanoligenens harbinense (strain DSM 18485 / JCM 12961 / CGMCC 1.5033 / YUAN-3) TaxID=663278 RepID=E6U3Q2_ETHHY|nr:hypothetical protein Ethha_2135 [Ethanoligenens harbinense YUAN-3]AVQ96688.1 hypothetical protein CXQ68_10935 [Ethanoligenens harbinense YUAN-3]AYF39348.1 hypothetical protein CXP51_10825 [Ethanoligenens harbinense]AYF42173.1 hypothetical protein CN246_11375 [Ethanoligenens harbinense]QCN92928.1 hypothetical protein DRA42_10965 [Ethanoligenens harbinense]